MKYLILLLCFVSISCTTFDKTAEDKYDWYLDKKETIVNVRVVENSNVNVDCFPLMHTIACSRIFPEGCVIYLPLRIDNTPDWIVKHELMHCFGWKHNIKEK